VTSVLAPTRVGAGTGPSPLKSAVSDVAALLMLRAAPSQYVRSAAHPFPKPYSLVGVLTATKMMAASRTAVTTSVEKKRFLPRTVLTIYAPPATDQAGLARVVQGRTGRGRNKADLVEPGLVDRERIAVPCVDPLQHVVSCITSASSLLREKGSARVHERVARALAPKIQSAVGRCRRGGRRGVHTCWLRSTTVTVRPVLSAIIAIVGPPT